jgi:ribonucleoside-diphosphate reductase subunit M2
MQGSKKSITNITNIEKTFNNELKDLSMFYEPILDKKNYRYEALPISNEYKNIYDIYLTHKRAFWDVDEIDFSKDKEGYKKLNEQEKHFIKYVLAFFAYSDAVVNNNIGERFIEDIQILEAQMFYRFQGAMEDVHSITYSLMIQTLIDDSKDIQRLQEAVKTVSVLAKKKKWAEHWTGAKDAPFHIRLLAFTIVEGVFFSASFCAIYWIKEKKGNIIPGLTQSNELIARDEGLHTKHAIMLFHHLKNKPSKDIVHAIFKEAVDIETEFITESLPCTLIGMNSSQMVEYVQYISDTLLYELGYPKLYKVSNPFKWIESISLQNKTNFFESRVTEYARAGNVSEFKIEEDF